MLRKRVILKINDTITQVCGFLSQTNCNCGCASCECAQTCVDCVDCPNLTIADIRMQISRAGDIDSNGNLIPLFYYPAFTLAGNQVCFLIDSSLTSLNGRYIGKLLVQGNNAGCIEMQVGAPYTVCRPYTINEAGLINDMQPSGM